MRWRWDLGAVAGVGLLSLAACGASASAEDAPSTGGGGGHRVFFKFTDAAHAGRRIEAYSELVPEFSALTPACQ